MYVRTDGGAPTRSAFNYSSVSWSTDDFVNVAPGTCCYVATTTLRIAVYGFTAARFEITFATAAAVVTLADGVSQPGTMDVGQAHYYALTVSTFRVDVSFALTALVSDTDLFVSPWPANSPRYRPGPAGSGSACRSGTAFGSDAVDIVSTGGDPCYCTPIIGRGCVYIVGVYCDNGDSPCRYTLTGATVAPYRLIPLTDSQPLSNEVPRGLYRWFSFDPGYVRGIPPTANVTLRLSWTTGGGVMFATNRYNPDALPRGAGIPTNNSGALWTSPLYGPNAGTISIPATDNNVQQCYAQGWPLNCSGVLTIAVWGALGEGTTAFTISGTASDAPLQLVPGRPSPLMSVNGGVTAHFAVDVASVTADLVITTTAFRGSVVTSLDPVNTATGCAGGLGDGTQLTCDGAWSNDGLDNSTDMVRVSWAAPCTGSKMDAAVFSGLMLPLAA